MAFRSTAFDPVNKEIFKDNDPSIDFNTMEMKLAQEMSKMKIVDERKKREIEKICTESDELKELQNKIKAAYLNKERTAQIAENQFRSQQHLVSATISQFEILMTQVVYQQISNSFSFSLNTGARRRYRHRIPPPQGEGRHGCPLCCLRETTTTLYAQERHPEPDDESGVSPGRGHGRVHEGEIQRRLNY